MCTVGRHFRLNGTRVLAYHSVDDSGSVLSTSPAIFRRHMAYLKKNGYKTISLSDYLDKKIRGAMNSSEFVITFDDGFQSLFAHAFPILKEYSFEAVVFLVTDYVGKKAGWMKRDEDAIMAGLVPQLTLPSKEIEAEKERLRTFADYKILSWEEIQEMQRHGIEFQSHSCSHPFFSTLDKETIRKELELSRTVLEDKLQKKITWFCYPYGDYKHADITILLRDIGYEGAFADDWNSAREKNDERYLMNRVPVWSLTTESDLDFYFSAGYEWYRYIVNLIKKS